MKWIGAILVILGCGGAGMAMASAYRTEETLLRQLGECIAWMECQLDSRGADLERLFSQAAQRCGGVVGALFAQMSAELSARVAPDAFVCMRSAVDKIRLPEKTAAVALALGRCLGEFHLEEQLRQLSLVQAECARVLQEHTRNRDDRLRSYRILGLCAGLALAIVLL